MTPPRRHPPIDDSLVEDVLIDEPLMRQALAASLLATRQAAAQRRLRKRLTQAAGMLVLLACLAVAASGWHWPRVTPPPLAHQQPPAAVPSSPVAAFVSVTTRPEWAPSTVATTPLPTGLLTTSTESVTIVSTRATTTPYSLATEADLFAAAGSRPAALRRHPDGTGHWVWLDSPARPR
ncbi:MAG: hypothetical protein ACKV19_04635 [Verrucomicrobiales bacterium]